jgi:homoserine O-acetyltransferase
VLFRSILFTTWFSGTGKILEQVYVGDLHALDPTRYFIVIVEQLGNGLSTSPHNAEEYQRGAAFPELDIADDVAAQRRLLLEKFGVEHLALVLGASMGAQQTYEWAVRYPHAVRRAAPIAGTAVIRPHNRLYTDFLISSLEEGLRQGAVVAGGLRRHAHLWAMMGWSSEFYRLDRPKALGFDSLASFLSGFMEGYFSPMDPYSLICMARKWQSADLARHTEGSLEKALASIRARTCVIALRQDLLFPPSDCMIDAALIRKASFEVVDSVDGHMALFGADPGFMPQIDRVLKKLLATA